MRQRTESAFGRDKFMSTISRRVKPIFLALMACLISIVVGAERAIDEDTQLRAATATMPSSTDLTRDMPPKLLEALCKPFWRTTARQWEVMLQDARFSGVGGLLRIEERDQIIAGIANGLRSLPPGEPAHLVIVENVSGGFRMQYSRYGIWLGGRTTPEIDALLEKARVQKVEAKVWQVVREPLEKLVELGGCNNGADQSFDATDATTITYFDGSRWHTDTWFYLAQPLTAKFEEAFNRSELRPVAYQYLRLLEALSVQAIPGTVIGGPWARDLVESFGKVRE